MELATNQQSEPGTEDRPYKTEMEYWQTEDGAWKATEAASDHEVYGRGKRDTEALRNYFEAVGGLADE